MPSVGGVRGRLDFWFLLFFKAFTHCTDAVPSSDLQYFIRRRLFFPSVYSSAGREGNVMGHDEWHKGK